jgi:hypothetical protein
MNKITIKEVNIMKYIKMTKDKNVINAVEKILEKNENMLLKDFLQLSQIILIIRPLYHITTLKATPIIQV